MHWQINSGVCREATIGGAYNLPYGSTVYWHFITIANKNNCTRHFKVGFAKFR